MNVLGLMSGTSLDGLDVVLVAFNGLPNYNANFGWRIIKGETFSYSAEWQKKLQNAIQLSGLELMKLHHDYGVLLGTFCNQFLDENKLRADLISSHGHTVFHEPNSGFTTQIGDGNAIAATTKIDTVYDFRSLDVALGGQGAPLVPIGDQILFTEYDCCLNLGGIANISFDVNGQRKGFDICPFNLLLNHFANKQGFDYDDCGQIARTGQLDSNLLNLLSLLEYYQIKGAKSLDKEALLKEYLQLIEKTETSIPNILAILVEHFALEIEKSIIGNSVLITGGGAFNQFFIERLKFMTKAKIIIPNNELINFKEALVFALMGYLRVNNKTNVWSSYTGSQSNSCSGSLVLGNNLANQERKTT